MYKLEKVRHLRSNMTEAENILWQRIRNKQIGHHVRRQYSVHNFICDFYIAKAKLIVEVDGLVHLKQIHADNERDLILKELGYKILRIKNEEVFTNIEYVVEKIKGFL